MIKSDTKLVYCLWCGDTVPIDPADLETAKLLIQKHALLCEKDPRNALTCEAALRVVELSDAIIENHSRFIEGRHGEYYRCVHCQEQADYTEGIKHLDWCAVLRARTYKDADRAFGSPNLIRREDVENLLRWKPTHHEKLLGLCVVSPDGKYLSRDDVLNLFNKR